MATVYAQDIQCIHKILIQRRIFPVATKRLSVCKSVLCVCKKRACPLVCWSLCRALLLAGLPVATYAVHTRPCFLVSLCEPDSIDQPSISEYDYVHLSRGAGIVADPVRCRGKKRNLAVHDFSKNSVFRNVCYVLQFSLLTWTYGSMFGRWLLLIFFFRFSFLLLSYKIKKLKLKKIPHHQVHLYRQ